MSEKTAILARSITWTGSKQSYLTARLLADRDWEEDCLRAYAYFRWADDKIDLHLSGRTESVNFIERQKALIDELYRGLRPVDLVPEEAMLADLVAHDSRPDSGLRSFIRNFLSVLEFDARRRGQLVCQNALAAYTDGLAVAVMDGIQYFIGHDHPYPRTQDRTLAVRGAHITHMLRDMLEDLAAGLVNIPAEYLEAHGLDLKDVNSKDLRQWVREQVELARYCFQAGKTYIDSLDVFRCKLAGFWYCARFERILNTIQRDGYRLRAEYHECRTWRAWLGMTWLGLAVTWKHLARRARRFLYRTRHPTESNST